MDKSLFASQLQTVAKEITDKNDIDACRQVIMTSKALLNAVSQMIPSKSLDQYNILTPAYDSVYTQLKKYYDNYLNDFSDDYQRNISEGNDYIIESKKVLNNYKSELADIAKIEQRINGEIDEIKSEVDSKNKTFSNLKSEKEKLEEEIRILSEGIDKIEEQIMNLKKDLESAKDAREEINEFLPTLNVLISGLEADGYTSMQDLSNVLKDMTITANNQIKEFDRIFSGVEGNLTKLVKEIEKHTEAKA